MPEPVWVSLISAAVYLGLRFLRNLLPKNRQIRRILKDLATKDDNNETPL